MWSEVAGRGCLLAGVISQEDSISSVFTVLLIVLYLTSRTLADSAKTSKSGTGKNLGKNSWARRDAADTKALGKQDNKPEWTTEIFREAWYPRIWWRPALGWQPREVIWIHPTFYCEWSDDNNK